MPLFFPHNAKTQNQQSQTAAAAQQPALQTLAQQQAKSKSRQAAAMQMISPTHTYTPGIAYASQKAKKNLPKKRKVLKCKCNEPGEPSGVTMTAAAWSRTVNGDSPLSRRGRLS